MGTFKGSGDFLPGPFFRLLELLFNSLFCEGKVLKEKAIDGRNFKTLSGVNKWFDFRYVFQNLFVTL